MFACVEGAGVVVVQKVLLEFLPVGVCGWVWQGGRDWWWFYPFGALLWWGGGCGANGDGGVLSFGFVHCGECG